jgi:hypothetical protein
MESYILYIIIALSIFTISALSLSIFLYVKLNKMQAFFDQAFSGKKVKNMEKFILDLAKKEEKLDKDIEDLYDVSNQINRISYKGINRIGVIKYNPFNENGRKDSFALAMLNGNGKGFILSSLSTENGAKIYLKEVENGSSEIPLTEEEQEALNQATLTKST